MSALDQDMSALVECCSNTDVPAFTDSSLDVQRPFAEQILTFGTATRRGIHMPALRQYLLENVPAAASSAMTWQSLTELFWFLFSQKAWEQIDWLSKTVDLRGLPDHIADLCFLAFYRMQKDRLMRGRGVLDFEREAGIVRKRLVDGWPDAGMRHEAYAAMLLHVTGATEEARRIFSPLDGSIFIEPFAGISSVLMHSHGLVRPDGASLEIIPCRARHVTLLSLDKAYFEKYAFLAARRYARTNSANGLHFHCVGFDPREAIAGWGLPVAIGVTIDREDLQALGPRQQRGYFAGARFLHLSRYVDLYQSVFVADVDGHVSRDVAVMAEEHRDADVVLTTKLLDPDREITRLPWEAVSAGSLLVHATDGGRRFARQLGAYLHAVVQNGKSLGRPIWYADQTALFYCWHDAPGDIRFATFTKFAFVQRGSWQLFEGERERLQFLAAD
jgi:hypothetical protein